MVFMCHIVTHFGGGMQIERRAVAEADLAIVEVPIQRQGRHAVGGGDHIQPVRRQMVVVPPSKEGWAASWLRYPRILAELPCQRIAYAAMARNGTALVLRRVMPPRVFATFSKKRADLLLPARGSLTGRLDQFRLV